MEPVIDANILFSAAITDSKTAELMLQDDLKLYAPEYLFKEFSKYEDKLVEKTNRERQNFQKFMNVLRKRIKLVPREEFDHKLEQARKITPDPDDAAYFGLALHKKCCIWTDDKELQKQERVEIITTTKLIESRQQ